MNPSLDRFREPDRHWPQPGHKSDEDHDDDEELIERQEADEATGRARLAEE
mgnify:CR=1 FL=1